MLDTGLEDQLVSRPLALLHQSGVNCVAVRCRGEEGVDMVPGQAGHGVDQRGGEWRVVGGGHSADGGELCAQCEGSAGTASAGQ